MGTPPLRCRVSSWSRHRQRRLQGCRLGATMCPMPTSSLRAAALPLLCVRVSSWAALEPMLGPVLESRELQMNVTCCLLQAHLLQAMGRQLRAVGICTRVSCWLHCTETGCCSHASCTAH